MAKTRIELVNRAASKLMVKASGQALDSEDYDVIDGIVESVLSDLASRGVVYVPDNNAIELDVFEWVADILADTAAPDFGLPRDANKVAVAEMRLHEINTTRPGYEPLNTAEYF